MINPDLSHKLLWRAMKPSLSRRKDGASYNEWKEEIRAKFVQLTGLDKIAENGCPLNFQIESEENKDGYKRIRFTFDSEVGERVPCYLLIPDTGKERYPVAITMQGHSTGFHNSIGEPKLERDTEYALGRGAFALQAVKNGYIALAIEQKGMGERRSRYSYGENNEFYSRPHMCAVASLNAIALGRTLIGERVWDIHKAIDVLEEFFPQCDMDKILITGNSGGGTISYYSACFDERIKLSAPSCSFAPYGPSILNVEHCACNYIPSVYQYFDMQDLACLIAPRKLIVITGEKDPIFPIAGVKNGFERVKEIFTENGVSENCRLEITPKEHWWCEDIVWTAINEETAKLGWQ